MSLREARLRAGLTQQELAQKSGMEQQHVSLLERGKMSLTDDRARKLGPSLEVEPARLRLGDFNSWIATRLESGKFGPAEVSEVLKRAESLIQSELLNAEEKSELLGSLEPVMTAVFEKARRKSKE